MHEDRAEVINMSIQYGLYVPNIGESSYARTFAELARDAEEAGWDGFFLFDTIMFKKTARVPTVDPFIALAAISMTTRRIRIGTMVTPLARRRPWKVARETVSIDHLSDGRLIQGVGLGDPPDGEFEAFGEDSNAMVRAEKLDEGLDIVTGLWSGEEFSHRGGHYRIDKALFLALPKQSPRIPIWVGGFWPHKPPFRRAARWDGVIPLKVGSTSSDWRARTRGSSPDSHVHQGSANVICSLRHSHHRLRTARQEDEDAKNRIVCGRRGDVVA